MPLTINDLFKQLALLEFKQLGLSSALCETATAAVNTGVTLTLPAVASKFHYLTLIQIVKFFAVVGAAATSPSLVTTTNLPGDPVFSFNTAGAVGSASVQLFRPTTPMKSSVVNTATTIVCPAQLETIWRANVWYYTGD